MIDAHVLTFLVLYVAKATKFDFLSQYKHTFNWCYFGGMTQFLKLYWCGFNVLLEYRQTVGMFTQFHVPLIVRVRKILFLQIAFFADYNPVTLHQFSAVLTVI